MSGPYLYCQRPECGVYLGSLGGSACHICGWQAPFDANDYESDDEYTQLLMDRDMED